jgi:hypothetical protein
MEVTAEFADFIVGEEGQWLASLVLPFIMFQHFHKEFAADLNWYSIMP